MTIHKRSRRPTTRVIRPPVKPVLDQTPWADESSDEDPSYTPEQESASASDTSASDTSASVTTSDCSDPYPDSSSDSSSEG